MTDNATVYPAIGREFAGHGSVNYSAEEYVRAAFWHTNTVENFFSIFKRGIVGIYHHVGESYLSSPNRDVSVFPNLEMSLWLGRAVDGRGAPAQRSARPPSAVRALETAPPCFYRAGSARSACRRLNRL